MCCSGTHDSCSHLVGRGQSREKGAYLIGLLMQPYPNAKGVSAINQFWRAPAFHIASLIPSFTSRRQVNDPV